MTSREGRAALADIAEPGRLFAGLAERRGLVLAVSGGTDSTALMVLVARWTERPPVIVVSVDHGLREEAAAESRQVVANAKCLGLKSKVVVAPRRPAGGNLQDWARRMRYRLLAEAARDAGFDTIVTAHHEDDQAETFLLRLARGSGVYGLGAMPREGVVEGIALVRPFLHVPRTVLRAIAAESGLPVVEDPSNRDTRFDRVRVRNALPELASIGLGAQRLSETAGRLGRAAAALDHYATALLAGRFAANSFGVVAGDRRALAEVPEEVALRALALLLQAVGGGDYTPRLESVESLLATILGGGFGDVPVRTLAGVMISAKGDTLTARREWGRKGVADAAAPAGATLVWDRRFAVKVPPIGGTLKVGALARSDRRLRATGTGASTVRALPGLYRDGTLVAVPPLVEPADRGVPLDRLEVACVVGDRLGITGNPGFLPL